MNSKELSKKILTGTEKSLNLLVRKKAFFGQSFVVADEKGGVSRISAKQLLKKK